MKKTLVALFALGCMATAADVEYTIDNAWSIAGTGEHNSVIDEALLTSSDALSCGNYHGNYSTTVTLSDMAWSINPATVESRGMVLTSVQIVSRPANDLWKSDTATVTVTVGDESYTSAVAQWPTLSGTQRGIITFVFDQPVNIKGAGSLTITTNNDPGFIVYQPKNEGYELHGDTAVSSPWHMAVRLNVKTPEPATATLSLLALAGLASRRRRH